MAVNHKVGDIVRCQYSESHYNKLLYIFDVVVINNGGSIYYTKDKDDNLISWSFEDSLRQLTPEEDKSQEVEEFRLKLL